MLINSNSVLANALLNWEDCLYELTGMLQWSGYSDEFVEKEAQSHFNEIEELMSILKPIVFHYRETGEFDSTLVNSLKERAIALNKAIKQFKSQYRAYKETHI